MLIKVAKVEVPVCLIFFFALGFLTYFVIVVVSVIIVLFLNDDFVIPVFIITMTVIAIFTSSALFSVLIEVCT